MFSSAFGGSWLLPLLGIIVLPFTTLMYVLVWTPAVGVIGWDWMWVGMGFLIDITSAAGAQYANKRATVPA